MYLHTEPFSGQINDTEKLPVGKNGKRKGLHALIQFK